jgi:hypothetical protein
VAGSGKASLPRAPIHAAGCTGVPLSDQVIGPGYVPSNIYSRQPVLAKDLRRVAVLPLASATGSSELAAGTEALEPLLWTELAAVKRFEIHSVRPAELQAWTGRPTWAGTERLPPDLVDRLKAELGCDAVLFCQLTAYRAYPPLSVGWNLKLVDGGPAPILWSADEIFDAGAPSVANAARRYYQEHARSGAPGCDSQGILISARRFGQYTLNALLLTLPRR